MNEEAQKCQLIIGQGYLAPTSNHFSANYYPTINLPMRSPNTQPLPHYHANSTWENGISYLVDSRGIRLPGITSILKATKSPQEKAQLANWRQRVGTSERKFPHTHVLFSPQSLAQQCL
jgi:genome maintenance exonuclease 1